MGASRSSLLYTAMVVSHLSWSVFLSFFLSLGENPRLGNVRHQAESCTAVKFCVFFFVLFRFSWARVAFQIIVAYMVTSVIYQYWQDWSIIMHICVDSPQTQTGCKPHARTSPQFLMMVSPNQSCSTLSTCLGSSARNVARLSSEWFRVKPTWISLYGWMYIIYTFCNYPESM